jgi:hypothetical protein
VLFAPLLTACATPPPPPIPTAGTAKPDCLAFSVLSYSKTDTPETVQEIRAHNAAYRVLCPS